MQMLLLGLQLRGVLVSTHGVLNMHAVVTTDVVIRCAYTHAAKLTPRVT